MTTRPFVAPRLGSVAKPIRVPWRVPRLQDISLRSVVRVGLALVLVGTILVLLLADLHGRAQIRHEDRVLATTQHHLAKTNARTSDTNDQTDAMYREILKLESAAIATQGSLDGTNASISSADVQIFYAGVDLSVFDGCLSGVVQALDQVAVGQIAGAAASLSVVAGACSAVNPTG
jgi:hypothetical protein